jgi:hypothetical protein
MVLQVRSASKAEPALRRVTRRPTDKMTTLAHVEAG